MIVDGGRWGRRDCATKTKKNSFSERRAKRSQPTDFVRRSRRRSLLSVQFRLKTLLVYTDDRLVALYAFAPAHVCTRMPRPGSDSLLFPPLLSLQCPQATSGRLRPSPTTSSSSSFYQTPLLRNSRHSCYSGFDDSDDFISKYYFGYKSPPQVVQDCRFADGPRCRHLSAEG